MTFIQRVIFCIKICFLPNPMKALQKAIEERRSNKPLPPMSEEELRERQKLLLKIAVRDNDFFPVE